MGNLEMQNRIYYLDFLRVAAIFAVVVLHAASNQIKAVEPAAFDWMVFNFYDSIVRWAVPVLVMISGTLFLDEKKELSLSAMHSKYIRRILIAFLFWSFLYAAFHTLSVHGNFANFFEMFATGNYHLWFLLMIIGLYLVTPIFRQIIKSDLYTKYFLVLSLIFTFIYPIL